MRSILATSLAAALALSSPALAQKAHELAPAGGAGKAVEQEQGKEVTSYNLDTINKLTKDLENSGYTDLRVLSNSFVVQAKDKNGNPALMTLAPNGVWQKQAKARTSSGSQTPAQRE